MKLTPTQTVYLDHATTAHLERVKAQKTEREIALREADKRISGKIRDEDNAIRQAVDAGVPKDRIRVALGVGHDTIRAALLRTEEQPAAALAAEALPTRFEWANDDHDRVRVTLAGAEWDAQLAEMQPKLRKHHDANTAEYRILIEDGSIIARADMYDRTTENAYDHPVTAWLLYFGGLAEVQGWISEQGEGIAA